MRSSGFYVRIVGEKELQRKLLAMGNEASDVLEAAVVSGLLHVQNSAKDKVAKKSGSLSRSIHTEVIKKTPTIVEAASGTDLDYARRVEYGFSGYDSLGRLYNQSPRPYMRPAFDENKERSSDTVVFVIKRILGKYTK